MDSATIVSAALDSRQLEDSINKLVQTVASKTKEMADNFTREVGRMEQAVKNLGNIKIDSGGTADGGSSRRTSKQKEEETQVKSTTQAYKEQKTIVGELAMSFDNLNTAITKSNSKLAAKFDVTEQQKVQQLEAQRTSIEDKIVARQIEIDESYRSQLATLSKTRSELESKANLTSKEQADLKHVTTEWERINKIVRDISSRPIVAADDTTGNLGRLQQQLIETNKQLDESRKRIQEMNFERAKMYDGSLSGLVQNAQATMKYQNDTLKKSFEDLLKKPTHDVDEMRAKMERLQTFLNNIKPLNIFSPELIANGERAINKLKNEIQKFNDKPTKQAFADALKLPDRTQSEIITKINRIRDAIKGVEGTKIVSEAEIARANSLIDSLRDKWSKLYNAPRDRQLRIDFADALKMPTNNIDEIAAKLMRLQHILQEMRGMEVLSPEQISKGNQQISVLLSKLEAEMSLRQQINAVEQADMQNAQRRIELEAKYGEEVAKAAAIANEWLQKNKEAEILNKEGTFVIQDPKAGQTVGQSIEAQLLAYKAINGELNLELEVQKAIQNTVESIEIAEQRRIALTQGGKTASDKSFADYEDLRTAIAAVLRVRESEVSLANSEDASYKALSLTLKQLKQAYESLSASQRKSENADALIASIHETQRAMQEIQKQMSRPVNLANALALPEKTIDDISYKVQMLRAYAQGINIETNAGNAELRRVMSTIEGLNDGLKNAQKTTKQITIEANNIKFDNIAKMPTEGVKQVGAKIKEVKQYINELKNQPIVDEKNLKRAEALYDRLIKQSQKLNETRGTHSNVNDALNVRVKTLDEIAKKMQRLQAIRQNLDINKQKADIDRINAALGELKKQQDGVLQRNANMIKSNNALGRSWNYMKNRLAFYFTVGASTQFIKNLIEIRSQYEMNEKALGILLDSASRGTRIFNELSQMSLVSPYTLIELSSAAKQLTAYDIAAKDVVDTTRRLADMASAVGVPVERLTYALGQIKAYGYLNSRDARMFANAGIPLVKQLADYYSELEGKIVSTADVYDRMKKKAIDYNDVMKVVTKMTDEGGKFFDFQAKMADTLKVRLANLTLAWNNMLNDLGKSNQGGLTTGIKSLTVVFRHWREIYRVVSTLIVALGAYKAATMLAGMTTKSSIGSSAVAAWFNLARGVKSAKDAVALFSLTLKSIPFTAWFTTIATLASYFYLFNNSTDGLKQKLEDIATAFDGVRKEITDLYADALKSDSIGSQLTKLRDMLELAQTELGVTIPIKLEEVNEGNVKQKLKEVKDIIDNYLNFSQEFSEAAAGTKFNELMNEFGANARSTYTGISESINTVVVALQDLVDKGNASKRDLKILNELTSGQKEDESRIEYLQRLVRLYEELGLVGKKVTTPSLSFFSSSTDNMNELTEKQNEQLDRLGIKNKQVFENMLKDVQGYYSSSSIAQYQFEQQVERVAKRIDINNIPVEQRTLKLSAAINEEASLNNWNQFEKEFARQVANQKFGTQIEISEESKGVAEQDLKDWQKKQQEWAAKNGITIPINFQTNDTEISYAKRMLQAAKDAKEKVEVQQRKLAVGTGSQDAVDAAKKAYENARILAKNAGADLEQLDKKANAAAKKAAKAAETELSKALKDELSTIEKVRSIYKELTKEGASHADAIKSATEGWEETVNAINRVLTKNGLKGLNLNDFVGVENPREILKTLQAQLDEMVKRGAKPAEIQVLQEKIKTIKVDAEKYDLTKITKGLNNELDRLKEEYELAIALDADPELGSMFADWMGIDVNDLPRTASEYAERASKELNKYLKENKANVELPNLLNVTDDDLRAFEEMKVLTDAQLENVRKRVQQARELQKKEVSDQIKDWDKLLEKYAEYETKISKIQNDAVKERVTFAQQFGSDEEKSLALNLQTQILAATDPQEKQKLIEQLQNLVKNIAGDDKTKINLVTAITNSEQQGVAKAGFEEFQKSPEWIIATGDLANLTDKAIIGLIDSINEYKRTATKLDPKQIRQMNKALSSLHKELRKGNPFHVIADAIDDAKERASIYDGVIAKMENTIEGYFDRFSSLTDEEKDSLKELIKALSELKEKQEEMQKIEPTAVVDGINNAVSIAEKATEQFNKMAEALGGKHMTEASETINNIMGNIQAAGAGAATGAQIGGGWGAAIGATSAGLTDLVARFADQWSGNRSITKKVIESEKAVKSLEIAFVDLQNAVDKAYGSAVIGARQATLANKELQLAEIQRQIELEKSRSSKNRDEDKILDLQRQYKELFYEIKNGYNDIVDDLMGTDVGSFAENLVSSMIDAFKQGEDYMKVFGDKFDEMIDNMIMKSIVSRVVSQYLDAVWEDINKRINDRTEKERKDAAKAQEYASYVRGLTDEEVKKKVAEQKSENWAQRMFDEMFVTQDEINEFRKAAENEEKAAKSRLDAASAFAGSDVDYIMGRVTEIMPELGDKLKNILGEYYKFGESSETQLSALQQGISQISETTANSIEAYLNGVSQQVYLHSELLTQIRDAIMGTDSDIQLGVQGQMLLQLQQSYITQQAIQGILEGWSSPNGLAVRVEMA